MDINNTSLELVGTIPLAELRGKSIVSTMDGFNLCPDSQWDRVIGEKIAFELSTVFHSCWGLLGTTKDEGGRFHLLDLTKGIEIRIYYAAMLYKISKNKLTVGYKEYMLWSEWAKQYAKNKIGGL